MGTLTPLLF